MLQKLNIPEEPQVLVFLRRISKNSLINQRNLRSIYFSMDAYVVVQRLELTKKDSDNFSCCEKKILLGILEETVPDFRSES